MITLHGPSQPSRSAAFDSWSSCISGAENIVLRPSSRRETNRRPLDDSRADDLPREGKGRAVVYCPGSKFRKQLGTCSKPVLSTAGADCSGSVQRNRVHHPRASQWSAALELMRYAYPLTRVTPLETHPTCLCHAAGQRSRSQRPQRQ